MTSMTTTTMRLRRHAVIIAMALLCSAQQREDSSIVSILARAPHSTAPVASFPVAVDDRGDLGNLEIFDFDEPADAAAAFCVKHSLEPWLRTTIIERVCSGQIADVFCGRTRAVAYRTYVQSPFGDFEFPGEPFVLFDDEKPAAVVELYLAGVVDLITQNRSKWDAMEKAFVKKRDEVIEVAKQAAESGYSAALAEIDTANSAIEKHRLEEPAQRLPPSGFGARLLEHVCALEGCTCAVAGVRNLIAEIPITLDAGSNEPPIGHVRAYEDDEAADTVYLFAKEQKMEDNAVFRDSLMKYLCAMEKMKCTRTKALVFLRSPAQILGGVEMSWLPNLEIWEKEEAADAVHAYALRHGLLHQKGALLLAACADGYVDCERGTAVTFRFPVTEGEEAKGDIELFEDQLPADAVYDFCRREKYLQPKFTKRRVRATLHASFCAALESNGLLTDQRHNASCAGGPLAAREVLFFTEFAVHGLSYKMRFYESDYNGPLLAATAFCDRIVAPTPGCVEALEPLILEQLARAERRRFEMTSPFGFDYYLTLRQLRDTDNSTLREAYLEMVEEHLAPHVDGVEANLTRANETLKAASEARGAAQRALATVHGERLIVDEVLDNATFAMDHFFQKNSSSHVEIEEQAAIAHATFLPGLLAAQRILDESTAHLARIRETLLLSRTLSRSAFILRNDTKEAEETLELRSRVLKEANTVFSDAEKRDSNDTPCEKIFGACCAKATPGGGKDIKCGGDFSDA